MARKNERLAQQYELFFIYFLEFQFCVMQKVEKMHAIIIIINKRDLCSTLSSRSIESCLHEKGENEKMIETREESGEMKGKLNAQKMLLQMHLRVELNSN